MKEMNYIKATLTAFGPDEGVTFTKDTWAKLHQSMSEVVAQPVPLMACQGKELSEQLKLCARNVAFAESGRVDMSSAAMQEMFALIEHVCVGIDSPPVARLAVPDGWRIEIADKNWMDVCLVSPFGEAWKFRSGVGGSDQFIWKFLTAMLAAAPQKGGAE